MRSLFVSGGSHKSLADTSAVCMGGAVRLDVGFGSIALDASFRSARMGVPTPCFLHGLLNVVIGSCISDPAWH